MANLGASAGWGLVVGGSLLAGAVMAALLRLPASLAATVTAFGGGEAARGESIAAGIFVDGVPESLALGLTIAEGELGVALLAGILLGNLVESYGAAQPILAGGHSRSFVLRLLGGIGTALAAATVLGGTVLADASPSLVGTAQAVAAGAVLAVISIARRSPRSGAAASAGSTTSVTPADPAAGRRATRRGRGRA